MKVEHLEVVVEEPSMEAALRVLLPKMIGDLSFEVVTHQCKSELLGRLPQRLQGYARRRQHDAWFREHCRIAVVVDRDDDACDELKASLEEMAATARLTTRAKAKNAPWFVLNRIAIEELEAWYFGDWDAVREAYPRVPPTIPDKASYRDPDDIHGTWEHFERVLQGAGYFEGGLRKIEAARDIAARMSPSRNRSHSFCVLRDALLELSSA
jgi:hypothetical protein